MQVLKRGRAVDNQNVFCHRAENLVKPRETTGMLADCRVAKRTVSSLHNVLLDSWLKEGLPFVLFISFYFGEAW